MIKRESAFKSIQWKKPAAGKVKAKLLDAGLIFDLARTDDLQGVQVRFGNPIAEGETTKQQTIHLLTAAAEIEHQLLVEYLYAGYSLALTPPPGSGITASQLAQWRSTIVGVAKEEMGHLLTVQNLLLFLGAPPYLGRISPASNGHAPFPFRLEPLSLLSLAKFVSAESPNRKSLDARTLQRAQPAYDLAKKNNIDVTPVGMVYAQLYFLFQTNSKAEGPWDVSGLNLGKDHLNDTDFEPGSVAYQGLNSEWSPSAASLPQNARGIFVAQIQSRQDALQALHDISTQGEGVSGATGTDSHFVRFLDIYGAIPRDPAHPDQLLPGLVRPFPVDPVYGPGSAGSPPDSRITDSASAQWCRLLDFQYHLLLAEIALSLTLDANAANGVRGSYLTTYAIMNEMVGNIRRISATLAMLPRTPGVPPTTASAAPPFSEIDFPPMDVPPANPPIGPAAYRRKILARWAKELVDAAVIHVNGMRASGIQSNGCPAFPSGGGQTSNEQLDADVLQPILALP